MHEYNDEIDPSASGNEAIAMVVRLLLRDPRVDPSNNYNYAIGMALENGHIFVVMELLKDQR